MKTETVSAPTEHRRSTSRRGAHHRVRHLVVWLAVVLLAVVGVFYLAGGWFFAGRIYSDALKISVTGDTPTYNLTITALPPGAVTLRPTGSAPPAFDQRSSYALMWPGGTGQVGPALGSGDSITRTLSHVVGTPPTVGSKAALERDWYLGDPKTALGLDFSEVPVAGPLSPLPAWYVPAAGMTWAVMVHGKGGLRREMLRQLESVHAAGLPALVITYRNDAGTVQDPSGMFGYGATEWPDLQAAVGWATAHGAQHVVLVGNSMGGAIVASFMQHSDQARLVRGIVLDSAMLDFSATVELGAANSTLPVVGTQVPSSLTWVAERLATVRYGVSWSELDYVADPGWVTVPVLAIYGADDPKVPVSIGERLAAARPDLVRLEVFPGAAHVESWNTDRPRYEQLLSNFLGSLPAG